MTSPQMTTPKRFYQRREALERYIEDGSQYYYERLEMIRDKPLHSFLLFTISSTVCESYDFLEYALVFSPLSHCIPYPTEAAVRSLYRLSAVYVTLSFIADRQRSRRLLDMGLEQALAGVFGLSGLTQTLYDHYKTQLKACKCSFEASISRQAAAALFGQGNVNALTLAFVNHFFYNVRKRFFQYASQTIYRNRM